MLTERTNLANLVTIVHNSRPAGKTEATARDSFESFVAKGGIQFQQQNKGTNQDLGVEKGNRTEQKADDTYETRKLRSDYSSKAEKIKNRETVGKPGEKKDLAELTQDEMNALETDIREALKKNLNLSDEELDALLATMNLNVFQLLQPEIMQEFLLTATDSQPVDLLTDETLTGMLQDMQKDMDTLIKQYDLNPEVLKELTTEIPAEIPEGMSKEAVEQAVVSPQDLPEDTVVQEKDPSMEQMAEELDPHESDAKALDNRNEPKDTFTVQEENTGIEVTVKTVGERKDSGTNPQTGEQTRQGIAEGVVNQLTQAVNELEEVPTTAFRSEIQQVEIIRQVIEQIKIFSGNDMNRMEVQLYPEHLGKVQIQVLMKSGVMTAQITTETEMAKAAIENQLQQLKNTFQEQSMKVEAVEVSVATSDFQKEQNRQDTADKQRQRGSGRNRLRMNGFGGPEELSVEEEQEAKRLEAQGASVEFSA